MKKKKNRLEIEWTKEDFVRHLDKIMKKQEVKDPKFKRVHAQLEPEWQEITKLIHRLLIASDEIEETSLIEQIASYRETAIYPLVEVLLILKKLKKKDSPKENEP